MCFAEFKIVPRVPYVPTSSRTLVTPVRELEPTPGKMGIIISHTLATRKFLYHTVNSPSFLITP